MFNLQNQKKITNLNVNAHIYNHEKFGCQHLHLESENNEKVFMVAFRTVPEDSTGVAHIFVHIKMKKILIIYYLFILILLFFRISMRWILLRKVID